MEYKFSVFKDLLKTKDTPYLVDLTKIVNRIKIGKSIEIINRVRNAKSKEEADQIKQELPCIIFAGEFAQRNGTLVDQSSQHIHNTACKATDFSCLK